MGQIGLYGTETGFGKNVTTSSAGAVGPFQFEPATAKSMGVNPYDFKSAAEGAARYLSQYKGRGVGGMLSAYNAGPAGGYQSGYVNTTLSNAKSYDGSAGAPVSTAASVPQLPQLSTKTETVKIANPKAAGFQLLSSLLRSEKGGGDNPLITTGALAQAAAPVTTTKTIPVSVPTSSSVPASTGAPAPQPSSLTLPKAAPPPGQITLPDAEKRFPAIYKAKAALEKVDKHPVGIGQLEHEVDLGENAPHAVIETPNGNVVKTVKGPVFLPHKRIVNP